MRLKNLSNVLSVSSWSGVDESIRSSLKQTFDRTISTLVDLSREADIEIDSNPDEGKIKKMKSQVLRLRNQYVRAEETINFYTVAVNSRVNTNVASLLRACDIFCIRSMKSILDPLGLSTPLVLTYLDKGLGASILKAGLRLWDGSISEVAAIKITYHNLFRPTAIIHETGHQIAHILGWTEELSRSLHTGLSRYGVNVREAYSSWASEITADAFSFAHTGFGSVAALNDVVSGDHYTVFSFRRNDPHPISYVRVLLCLEMCKQCYGTGPWDDLKNSFTSEYDIELAGSSKILTEECVAAIPDATRIILNDKCSCFGGRSLTDLIDPRNVSPRSLEKLEYLAGPALYKSHAWIWKESLRILALLSYKIGRGEGALEPYYQLQQDFMRELGFAIELN